MSQLIYFSSKSENTHRFIQRLGLPAQRIAINAACQLQASEPYILVVPTYGGGSVRGAVPRQVVQFLNNTQNRALLRAVIAAGNRNFGDAFCIAGDIISQKCQVPYLYRFELMGTPQDIHAVRIGVSKFWQQH